MQVPGASQFTPRVHGPQGINAPHAPFRGSEAAKSPAVGSDRLEISSAAEAAIQAAETGGIRQDLVGRIRSEIAAGTYETSDKLDVALNRLLDEMG